MIHTITSSIDLFQCVCVCPHPRVVWGPSTRVTSRGEGAVYTWNTHQKYFDTLNVPTHTHVFAGSALELVQVNYCEFILFVLGISHYLSA